MESPLGRHGLVPPVEVEALGPLLERAARPPHLLDDRADAAVAAAGDALGQRGPGVVPLQLHALDRAGGVTQQVDLALQLVDGVLAEPLERRVGLGHEAAHRRGHRRSRCVLLADGDALLAASSAMPSVSSSVSVGRPMRKYSFIRVQPCE